MQRINNIIDNNVYNYFQNFGSGTIKYLGNWKTSIPNNLNEKLSEFNWESTVTRDCKEIEKNISDTECEIIHKIGFFNKFESTNHIKWKIIEDRDLDTDWNNLHQELKKYLSIYKIWISQIPAGCCIPQHLDSIESFIQEYEIKKHKISEIKRLVILPEDVKPWHHLWYGNDIIYPAKAGDVYSFNFWEPHGGSNLGPTPKYTIQVIGI